MLRNFIGNNKFCGSYDGLTLSRDKTRLEDWQEVLHIKKGQFSSRGRNASDRTGLKDKPS